MGAHSHILAINRLAIHHPFAFGYSSVVSEKKQQRVPQINTFIHVSTSQ